MACHRDFHHICMTLSVDTLCSVTLSPSRGSGVREFEGGGKRLSLVQTKAPPFTLVAGAAVPPLKLLSR